jgi:RNA polymerase sigma-70 factor (ECF subfamily)
MSAEFEAVVDRCQRNVYTYATYLLRDPGAAEDLTQEVFLRLWRHWGRVDLERVEAWLTRVTRNLCYDRWRLKRTETRYVIAPAEGEMDSAVDRGAGPQQLAEATDFREHLESALATLSEPSQSVLVLREILGFKYTEISEALELPLNTVKVYLHRGRKKLRERLTEAYADEA